MSIFDDLFSGGLGSPVFVRIEKPPQWKLDMLAERYKGRVRNWIGGSVISLPKKIMNAGYADADEEKIKALFSAAGVPVLQDDFKFDQKLYTVDAPGGWRVTAAESDSDYLILADGQGRQRAGIVFTGTGEKWDLGMVFNPLVRFMESVENGRRVRSVVTGNTPLFVFGVAPEDEKGWDNRDKAFMAALASELPAHLDVTAYWDAPQAEMESRVENIVRCLQAVDFNI